LLDDIAVRAEHDVASLERRHQLEDALAAGSFLQVLSWLDRELVLFGQWLDGLEAAHVAAGQDRVDRFLLEPGRQLVGLPASGFGQGSEPIIALPFGPVAGLCVANNIDWHRT